MKQKHYKIILMIAVLGVLFLWGHFVYAQVNVGLEEVGAEIGLAGEDIRIIIAKIIRIFLGLLGIIIVGLIVYGGFLWMTAGGDPKKVDRAKSVIRNAVIGLILVLSSFALSHFILSSLIKATTKPGAEIGVPPGGPGGGFGSNVFVVRSISPAGSVSIRNVTVRVVFNQAPDSAMIQNNVLVTKGGERVLGTYITNGSVVEFTPLAACPEPNQDRKCFDADSDFHVAVSNNLKSRTGLSLTCGGFAPNCEGNFHTGNLVDVTGPTVVIRNPAQNAILSQDISVNLEAEAIDDGGISYVEFYVDDSLVDIGAPSGGQTPLNFVASGIWDTTGAAVGSHEIKAKAYDINANNSVSASVFVNLRPAHCFNGIQDFDETDIDCGGNNCGVCVNGPCQRDSDCASGSCVNGICLELPLISGLDPKDGKEGNLVTIFGSYFGAIPGQVVFLGAEDPMDDKIALLGDCAAAWQANQIVVKVPEGAVSGPIKVTTSAQLEDATNDERGPRISDFVVNNITRPGICGLSPNSGVRSDVFVISGLQFGESQGASQAVMADRDINPQIWSDLSITGIVPALVAGAYPVRVIVNGQLSNSVNFRVSAEETGLKPVISYIDPDSAVKGDYVTLFGSNFGGVTGLVIFKNKRTGDEAYGDTSFPAGCENNFWQNTSITIKVPSLFKDGRTKVSLGDYGVRIKRRDDIESDSVNFNIREGAARPGVCRINPNNGPAGRTAVMLIGERFGLTAGLVVFTRQNNASISSWNDGEIRATVPVAAETGAVKVVVNSLESNAVNFTVADCNASGCGTGEQCCANGVCLPETEQCAVGLRQGGYLWRFSTGLIPLVPRVVEECSDGVSPSPAPWDARRGGNNVCVNAAVGARFTTDVDQLTLNSSNILVYKCVGADENPCAEVENVAGAISSWNNGFSFAPSANLSPSTYYQIFLKTGIRGAGEGGGYMEERKDECGEGFSYCFGFQTRADAQNCELGNVIVNPANKTSDKKDDVIDYNASAISKDDICILLNGYSYNWDWYAREADDSPTVKATVATQDSNGDGRVDPQAQATTNAETAPGPAIRIWAAVPTKNRSDYGELVIGFTDPKIIEYWPKCNTACVNAEVGFKTNVSLDQDTFSNNLHLYKCENESCSALRLTELGVTPTYTYSEVTKQATVVLNHLLLEDSTYYRVIIDGGQFGIKSTSGALLSGANYGSNFSWMFKTRNSAEPCEIDSVSLAPESTVLKYIGEKSSLSASALGAPDDCNPQGQRLVATDYSWRWTSANPDIVAMYYAADGGLLNVLPRGGRINCAANCLNTGTINISVCGNSRIEKGEDCDEGNIISGDGCSERCLNEGNALTCGNGIKDAGEDCDDGNTAANDGCSSSCLNEGSSKGGSICGNGDIGDGEDCDDGNSASGDGCSAECLNEGSVTGPYPVCGNGGLPEEGEDCDDGNILNGDGCSNRCLKEGLNPCANPTDSNCCGNNRLETGEDCDDGNIASSDGCSRLCLNEGSNIVYGSVCGNGLPLETGEECEFISRDINIDPFQYVVAENSSCETDGECRFIEVRAEAQNKPGQADVNVQCVCENDLMCAPPYIDRKDLGCGANKCCYLAPRVESVIPADRSSNVCRNATVGAIFNQEMDQASFAGNVFVYRLSGTERVDATTSTITGLSFSAIEAGGIKKTKVSLNLKAALSANKRYEIRIPANVVKSKNGVTMKNAASWEFTTGDKICALDEVRLIPPEMYIFDFDSHPISAQGYTKRETTIEPIESVPDVYAWDWRWLIADTNIVNFAGDVSLEGKDQNLQVPAAVRQGETTITAMASSTADIIYKSAFTKTASAPISVLICENPWPARTDSEWSPWVFTDSRDKNLGFEAFYCRDYGEEHYTPDDLPDVEVVRVPYSPSLDILQEYLLTLNCPENNPNCKKGDAIGIRVNTNPEHFSPEVWYEKQGFGGSPSKVTVDGFEAIQDGRTVYISAPYQYNYLNEYTLYSNIFIISYNENASPYTVAVYNQLLSNFKFLANLSRDIRDRRVCKILGGRDWAPAGKLVSCLKRSDCQRAALVSQPGLKNMVYCDAKKTLLRRDMKRIAQIRDMEEKFYSFGKSAATCSRTASLRCYADSDCPSGETCVKNYPKLEGGTFISYLTNSKWSSWQSALGNTLGYALPEDLLNEFSFACEEPYNALTCFNSASSTFYCPRYSRFYEYKGRPDGKEFTLGFDLEYTELFSSREPQTADKWAPDGNWRNPIPVLYSDGNYILNAHKSCADNVISAGSGRCGDGIVGAGEVCELGETRIESCGVNQFRTDTCNSKCTGWEPGDCSTTRCGDGVVQGSEVCDDGSLNGRYGRCGATCQGIGHYCGDGNLDGPDPDNDKEPSLNHSYGVRSGPEECDLGPQQNGFYDSGCSSECKIDGPRCGDNIRQEAHEECDTPVAETSSEGCTIQYQVKSRQCGGDKYFCQSEIVKNYQNVCTSVTIKSCRPCNFWRGEPSRLSCGKCCSVDDRTCSSGVRNVTAVCKTREVCAWGEGSPCRWGDYGACAYPGACGNGIKEGIEECDDGNRVNTDGCVIIPGKESDLSVSCKSARCGDGLVRQGYEMCDMGSANDTVCVAPYNGQCVYCSNNCLLVTRTGPYCGNGIIDTPYEGCDASACDPKKASYFDCVNFCDSNCRVRQ